MATLSAYETINHEYKGGKNFITPHVIKFGKIHRNMAFELSSGQGFFGDGDIFGVTVVRILSHVHPIKTKRASELSKCCQSHAEALQYIEYLKDTAPDMDAQNHEKEAAR